MSFSICNLYFILFFRPFLVFKLISFDKSSGMYSSPLMASILRFQAGCLWLVLFLFFFLIPHLFVIVFAVEYVNSFNIVMSFDLISLMIYYQSKSNSILPILMLSLFCLFVSSFRSGSRSSMFTFCVLENSPMFSIFISSIASLYSTTKVWFS